MANAVFSPKDFKVWVIEEAATGTAPDHCTTWSAESHGS